MHGPALGRRGGALPCRDIPGPRLIAAVILLFLRSGIMEYQILDPDLFSSGARARTRLNVVQTMPLALSLSDKMG